MPKERTIEDVVLELIYPLLDKLEGDAYLTDDALKYRTEVQELLAYTLMNDIMGLDQEDEMLLMRHDAESMLEESLGLNSSDTIVTMAELTMDDIIDNKHPSQLDHNEMRRVINYAEELKTYLPTRG